MRLLGVAVIIFAAAACGALVGTAGGVFATAQIVTYTPPRLGGLVCAAFDARNGAGEPVLAFKCDPIATGDSTTPPSSKVDRDSGT